MLDLPWWILFVPDLGSGDLVMGPGTTFVFLLLVLVAGLVAIIYVVQRVFAKAWRRRY
jgi:hypothetical protein